MHKHGTPQQGGGHAPAQHRNTLVSTSVYSPTIPREAEVQVTDCDQKACLCKQKYLYNTSKPKNATDTQTFTHSHDLR